MNNDNISQSLSENENGESSVSSSLSQDQINKSLHYLIVEGPYASVMGNFTGGVFLTGFALALGANDFQIGLLGAIPALVNLAQMPTSYFVERYGQLKKITVRSAATGRLLWVAIALLPLLYPFVGSNHTLALFLFILAVVNILSGVTRLAWITWTSALVPVEVMGRFFAKRNLYSNGFSMVAGLIAGEFIDRFIKINPSEVLFGLSSLFVVGVMFGMMSVFYLNKMSEPKISIQKEREPFYKVIQFPFKDKNFRRLILFSVCWNFSTTIISPFFSVYMLNDVKLNYLFINSLGVIGGVLNIVSLKEFGILSDKFGNKPMLITSVVGKCIYPLLWVFTTSNTYWLFIVINMTSVFDAGLGLTQFNMLLKLAPQKNNSVYLAVYGTAVGLTAMIGPICGGFVANLLKNSNMYFLFLTFRHFKLLFLVSGLFRFCTLFTLKNLYEPEAKSVSYLFDSLRKRGIFYSTDEVMQSIQFFFTQPIRFIKSQVNKLKDDESKGDN